MASDEMKSVVIDLFRALADDDIDRRDVLALLTTPPGFHMAGCRKD